MNLKTLLPHLRRSKPQTIQRQNRAAAADLPPGSPHPHTASPNPWADPQLGHYYATSVPVYAAIKIRAAAVSRPPLLAYRQNQNGSQTQLHPQHPLPQLLNRPNPWYTRTDLWQATEIYLNLYGQAFWALEQNPDGQTQIWPLRPDRITILPDRQNYLHGFLYRSQHGQPIPYTPHEILWLRYFNPLNQYAGLSPLSPARRSVQMAHDSLRFNQSLLQNSAQPDFLLLTDSQLTDTEIQTFYHQWETRYQGPQNAHRPAIANFIKDIKTLGLSPRDMDFIQSLRWSLEDISRAYGVPKPLLSDLERATFANINAAERIFWRATIVPQLQFLQEQLNQMLLPRLGYPQHTLQFDLSAIEALQEDQNKRVQRQIQLLDRGVLTINELRQQHNLPPVPWGQGPTSPPTP